MWSSLLLVTVFLSSGGSTYGDDNLNSLDDSSLQYIYAFFRHGIRAPLYETYPLDSNKDKYNKLFRGNLGKLTTIGIKQMYGVGQKLKNEYGKFIGDFSEEKVRVSSTNMSRTIMTALSVMAGLFPPSTPLFPKLNWQPIPIWQDTADFDKVYLYNDNNFPKLALDTCPRYGEKIQKGYNIIKQRDETPERQKLYELLQKYTGKTDINSINEAYKLFDVIQMGNLNGLPVPEWAMKPQQNFNKRSLYPDLMTPLMVEWFYDCQWLERDIEMLQFYSGPLFDSINDQFKEKIEKPTNMERFRFHTTHDDTLYTLRWALGYDQPEFGVEPGDGIVFELHKQKVGTNDNYFVKVVYYHSLREGQHFKEVLELPGCKSPCSYEMFSKLYKTLTPQQWQDWCKVK